MTNWIDDDDSPDVDLDHTEDDRWDWDRNDPKQRCPHGTVIGAWWGPDLLCPACEAGDE